MRSAADRAATLEDDVVGTLTTKVRQLPIPRGAGLPPTAAVEGDVAAMALYAGAGAITDVGPVAELISDLLATFGSRDANAAR